MISEVFVIPHNYATSSYISPDELHRVYFLDFIFIRSVLSSQQNSGEGTEIYYIHLSPHLVIF